MSIIKLENITKSYSSKYIEVKALDDITLSVEPQEFVAIMGRSGSGKSTLMHMIGLLDRPTSGHLSLDGEEIKLTMSDSKIAKLRSQKVGFVFQSFNLLPRLSALQNVMLPLQYIKSDSRAGKKRAIDLLTQVGLGNRITHKPGQLSGGEKQRVAIARALINNPSIILADEPTGNLDTKSGDEIMQILNDLNKAGKTIVIVTHDQNIGDRCQRIIRLLDGKVVSS